MGFIWRFIRQQKWVFIPILLLDAFAWPLDVLLWPYILHVVVDIFSRYEGDRIAAWGALQGPIIGGLCLVFSVEIASRIMGFLMARAVPKLQANIRMSMFNHIQHHSPRYFNERFAGSLANKISDMTTQVEAILQQLFFPIIPAIMASLLGAVFLWFVNPLFSWILLGWIIVHVGICLKFTRSCDLYEHQHGEARSTLLGKVVDSLTNNFAVNLFYRFKYEKSALAPFQQEEMGTNIRAKNYVEKMRCITSALFILGVILGILGSILYLWLHNQITTGQAVQVFTTSWSIGAIMWTVGSALPILFQSFGTAKQAYSVMQDAQDLGDKPIANELKISKGEIVFENVSFHYGKKDLFVNKHARIHGGEKVGLVGFTGAGKSTFINLILRFFPLYGGKIIIDGQDIAQVTLESLRHQIALIPQDPILFHRTLQENIRYGKPDAYEHEIAHAAKLAHCEEFIRNIPKGYEAKVGERGTKLSGGEKQRIAIARAILADAPILILDEATSALDSVTEKYIQDSLEKLMKNRTTIVIAHRLSTLSRMDRILVFDKGKIVEDGTHASLLDEDGLYAHMWKMQVGGFLPEMLTELTE
ncbi:MAG: putative multidrug export ATP-binding/permease protein [Chlamydiales bacterium]|nr:putative multidrug export ATP-binding/permease protein [Chlamydiales bacterium]MCH9619200.1 putative multidrug export ATP-binding/permease protein [Chlamydiales bacterium]MCH9622462.1 putative multidrug export ATP-binding/permease protein [Chlamydiales bacterium]